MLIKILNRLFYNMYIYALKIYIYEKSGSMTLYNYISLCIYLSKVIIILISGNIIDQYSHRKIIIGTDIINLLSISSFYLTISNKVIDYWLILPILTIHSISTTLQCSTFRLNLIENNKRLNYVFGLIKLGDTFSVILAPVLMDYLLKRIKLIDSIFLYIMMSCCIILLLIIFIPNQTNLLNEIEGKLWNFNIFFGFAYSRKNPKIFIFTIFLICITLINSFVIQLLPPLVFSFSDKTFELLRNLNISISFGTILGCFITMAKLYSSKTLLYSFAMIQGWILLLAVLGNFTENYMLNILFIGFSYSVFIPIISVRSNIFLIELIEQRFRGKVLGYIDFIVVVTRIFSILVNEPLIIFLENWIDLVPGFNTIDKISNYGNSIRLLFLLLGIVRIILSFSYIGYTIYENKQALRSNLTSNVIQKE